MNTYSHMAITSPSLEGTFKSRFSRKLISYAHWSISSIVLHANNPLGTKAHNKANKSNKF